MRHLIADPGSTWNIQTENILKLQTSKQEQKLYM